MSKIVAGEMAGSFLGVVSSVLGTIVVFIAAAQALGPELFGKFAFTYAIISLLGLIFDYGYPVSLQRETRKPDNSSRGEVPMQALGLKATMFFLLTPAALVAPFLLGLTCW